jgi:hypothetical protein
MYRQPEGIQLPISIRNGVDPEMSIFHSLLTMLIAVQKVHRRLPWANATLHDPTAFICL